MVPIAVSLDSLIAAIVALSPHDRAKVAQALLEVELRSDLAQLLTELYGTPDQIEVSNREILAEIRLQNTLEGDLDWKMELDPLVQSLIGAVPADDQDQQDLQGLYVNYLEEKYS
ncbi:MAG: hypothetical protein ACO331_15035 [Prochlorothrix sp.]